MKKLLVLIGATLLVFGVVGQAGAILLEGNDIGFEWLFNSTPYVSGDPTQTPPGAYPVGASVEIPNAVGNDTTQIDLSDTNIAVAWLGTFGSATFYGPHFFDTSAQIDPFTSVSINPETNVSGFDISRISFDEDNIWINLQGLTGGTSDVDYKSVSLNLHSVPEPTTLLLLGIGLIGLAGLRRRKFFK